MDGNRWRRHRLKKRDRQMIAGYLRLAGVILPLDRRAIPPRQVSLRVTLPPGGQPDPDALFKSVNDALVQARALRDDSARWCQLGPVTFERGKALSTTIILEDLEDVCG
jgi:hypothetical protein